MWADIRCQYLRKFDTMWLSYVLLFLLGVAVFSVKREDFKTCDQTAYCKRLRNTQVPTGYEVDISSVQKEGSKLKARLTSPQNTLELTITGLTEGRIRVQIDELKDIAIRQRYIPKQALDGDPLELPFQSVNNEKDYLEIVNGDKRAKAVVHRSPFVVDLYNERDELISQINAGGKLWVDEYRVKEEGKEYPENFWEERFKSWTDEKQFGTSSIGVDITMVGFRTAYGLPEHADSFALRSTVGNSDPYRLFNLDVFEYEINNPMALYVAIPYLLAHKANTSAGILWLNAAETWIDTSTTENSKGLFRRMLNKVMADESVPNFTAHFMSEAGLIDVFFFSGPTPNNVHKQMAITVGVTPLPPLFSIAYHQCRWNYKDENDVASVNEGFDEWDIPMDVIWLDIEHTDGKKYFTWHPIHFPTPKRMLEGVAAKGRKMVTIIDPHIKKDDGYRVYKDAKDLSLFVKRKDNVTDFEGHCWPGASEYLDFFNPDTRDYWVKQFAFDRYEGSTEDLFIWNDMNEPSVFSGPEVSMDRDSIHYGGMEHREVHNIYGMQYHQTSFEGLLARTEGRDRPFLLTRSGFIGTQRSAAIWTGDNTAEWSHLVASTPMLLSLSISGVPFVGADVGGFFGNPSEELLVRWYQTAAYQPFFRAHAHIETRRREPWVFSEKTRLAIRSAIRERYELLPFWYALFYIHYKTGMPPMRPLFYHFPDLENQFAQEKTWLIGDALLVAPVQAEGATSVNVYLPTDDGFKPARWFNWHTGCVQPSGDQQIEVPLHSSSTPVFQRGGTIVPKWSRVRRSAWLMRNDPFTLIIALDINGNAEGVLYIDDAKTHEYQKSKQFVLASVQYKSISSSFAVIESRPEGEFKSSNWIERIEIRGVHRSPQSVKLSDGTTLSYLYDSSKQVLTIRKPATYVHNIYTIKLAF